MDLSYEMITSYRVRGYRRDRDQDSKDSALSTPFIGLLQSVAYHRSPFITWGFPSHQSTKVLKATPQGRRLGYHAPEQVSNQEPIYIG